MSKPVSGSMVAKREPNLQVARRIDEDEVFDTRHVVKTLEGLMTRVTNDKVTAETVNAACNCADKIVDILRLHLDVQRLRKKMGDGK